MNVLGFVPMPAALRMALAVVFSVLSVILPWGFRVAPIVLKKKSTRQVFILESIRASHFVERVRWCLDLSGASYVEVRPTVPFLIRDTHRPVRELSKSNDLSRVGSKCWHSGVAFAWEAGATAARGWAGHRAEYSNGQRKLFETAIRHFAA